MVWELTDYVYRFKFKIVYMVNSDRYNKIKLYAFKSLRHFILLHVTICFSLFSSEHILKYWSLCQHWRIISALFLILPAILSKEKTIFLHFQSHALYLFKMLSSVHDPLTPSFGLDKWYQTLSLWLPLHDWLRSEMSYFRKYYINTEDITSYILMHRSMSYMWAWHWVKFDNLSLNIVIISL